MPGSKVLASTLCINVSISVFLVVLKSVTSLFLTDFLSVIYLSIRLYIILSTHLFVSPSSINPSVPFCHLHLPIFLPVHHLSIHPSVYQSIISSSPLLSSLHALPPFVPLPECISFFFFILLDHCCCLTSHQVSFQLPSHLLILPERTIRSQSLQYPTTTLSSPSPLYSHSVFFFPPFSLITFTNRFSGWLCVHVGYVVCLFVCIFHCWLIWSTYIYFLLIRWIWWVEMSMTYFTWCFRSSFCILVSFYLPFLCSLHTEKMKMR